MTVTGRQTQRLGAGVAGLTDDDLLGMYRFVALARAVDERMWILNRAGRIPFVISGQGHEGAQVGIAWPLQKGHDWIAPFYRSIATCLTFGMSARDIMTAQYATASDPTPAAARCPVTTARTSTTSCRSRRRSRRRSSTPWASRSPPRSARPARSRWPSWARGAATRAMSTRR